MRPLIQFVRKLIKALFLSSIDCRLSNRMNRGEGQWIKGRKKKKVILIVVFYACKLSKETVSIIRTVSSFPALFFLIVSLEPQQSANNIHRQIECTKSTLWKRRIREKCLYHIARRCSTKWKLGIALAGLKVE